MSNACRAAHTTTRLTAETLRAGEDYRCIGAVRRLRHPVRSPQRNATGQGLHDSPDTGLIITRQVDVGEPQPRTPQLD